MKQITIEQFKNDLQKGEVKFSFIKKNGEERSARGTLNVDLYGVENTPIGSNNKYSNNQIRYFDLDSNGWRSFLWENFVKYN